MFDCALRTGTAGGCKTSHIMLDPDAWDDDVFAHPSIKLEGAE